MSYLSVFDSFLSFLSGEIDLYPADSTPNPKGTSLMTTVLANTKELAFLRKGQDQAGLELASYHLWNGLDVYESSSLYTTPIASKIEEVFRNAIVNLMSSNLLQ